MVGRHAEGGQLLLKSRGVRQPQVAQGQVRALEAEVSITEGLVLCGFTAAFADVAASSRAAKPETNAVLSIIFFFLHLWVASAQGCPLVPRAAPAEPIDS
jgi:hypothetical protein